MNRNKFIYHPIGTLFKECNVVLTPQEIPNGDTSCAGCWYNSTRKGKRLYNQSCYKHRHGCTPHTRKDKKQVIFVEVTFDKVKEVK